MKTTLSIKDIIREFCSDQDVIEKTQEQYKVVLFQLVNYADAHNILLRKATKQDIIKWKQYLIDNYKTRTIQNYIIIVRKFYKYLSNMGYATDITQGIKLPKRQHAQTIRKSLTNKQCQRLLESVKGDSVKNKRDYAIVLLMLTLGLRTIEVSRLIISDLEEGFIKIQGKGRIDKEKLKIEPEVYDAIQDYLLINNSELSDHSPLFSSLSPRNKGKRINESGIGQIIKKLLNNIGLIDNYTAHSLRHTAAIILLEKRESIEAIRIFLRHEDIKTTQIYLSSITTQIKTKNKASNTIVRELLNTNTKPA